MKIQITGIKEISSKLDDIAQKRMAIATVAAIKDTAFQMQAGLKEEMRKVFDRPTPWALGTVRVDITEAKKTTQTAWVGLDYEGGKTANLWETPAFAPHEVQGGNRGIKPSERQLRAAGILPEGYSIAPARDAWLDQYGNIPGPQMVQILSSVKAFGEIGYLMNRTGKSRGKQKNRYFVRYVAGRPIGIWERLDKYNASAVIIFIRRPTYKKRFDFYGVARRIALTNFERNWWAQVKRYGNIDIKK